MELYHQSIKTIIQLQQPQGFYLSSSNSDSSCCIRDCSFASHALDLDNQYDKSSMFFKWALEVLDNNIFKMQLLLDRINLELSPRNQDYIASRFENNGEEYDFGSPQIDGWATFLWSLAKHCEITNNTSLIKKNRKVLTLLYNYLLSLWKYPCVNCWEQEDDKVHISNTIAVYGGLRAIGPYLKIKDNNNINRIKQYIIDNGIVKDYLIRWKESNQTESILLWTLYPYKIFDDDVKLKKGVLSKVSEDLDKGGLLRYGSDNYYGGGVWPLLNCFLALGYLSLGQKSKAEEQYELVNDILSKEGICELIPSKDVSCEYDKWVRNFGNPSQQHLWTAAMYVILSREVMSK